MPKKGNKRNSKQGGSSRNPSPKVEPAVKQKSQPMDLDPIASNPQPMLTSVTGVLSLLEEPDDFLKVHALEQIDHESFYDDEKFPQRQLAALVAAKVFYHLEALDDALKYALGAADLFDIEQHSEFVDTLIAKCIDEYTVLRVWNDEHSAEQKAIDQRLEAIVNRMFDKCKADAAFKHAIGIAIEARRLDQLEGIISISGHQQAGLLQYVYDLCRVVIDNRTFRHQVLSVLVRIYQGLLQPDYVSMCQCLLFLNDPSAVAAILHSLIRKQTNDELIAYQLAFDLNENQNRPFLEKVGEALAEIKLMNLRHLNPLSAPKKLILCWVVPLMIVPHFFTLLSDYEQLKSILSGEKPTELHLQFLYSHDSTDINVLQFIKDKLEAKNAVTQTATVISHAFMHCGTTIDIFLRDNLEWFKKLTNWDQFTATASIGVLHQGNIKQSRSILRDYLPRPGSAKPYQEGGALFALGLIHSNHPQHRDFLLSSIKDSPGNDVLLHGGCLGLGLVSMATQSDELYSELKNVLFTDSAVSGEAAALAIGLVMLGGLNGSAIEELLTYAHETKHEKIIRGIAMAIALMCYSREEECEIVIEQLLHDKDPILRYGAMYAIALAFAATSNNAAIQKLLHFGVSDVSDDVRRAAVTAIGFVMADQPEKVPRLVSLLSESYNPHVRYGACLAVGIACAGSGNKEALELVSPLLKDQEDWVRQGAYIAMAMLLVQQSTAAEPAVESTRSLYREIIGGKGDTIAKFGAIVGYGIIDAGGRNCSLSLLSPGGHKKAAAIVGMALFPQFWYWYPYLYFLSLAVSPTAIIGLDHNLNVCLLLFVCLLVVIVAQIPREWQFESVAKPSLFAYVPAVQLQKEEEKKKVQKAQLSMAAKAKAKAKAKRQGKDDGDDDVEMKPVEEPEKEKEEEEEKKEAEAEAKEPEPESAILKNPVRVTWKQQKYVQLLPNQRFTPVKQALAPGFFLLSDDQPQEPAKLFEAVAPVFSTPAKPITRPEPSAPAPFSFNR